MLSTERRDDMVESDLVFKHLKQSCCRSSRMHQHNAENSCVVCHLLHTPSYNNYDLIQCHPFISQEHRARQSGRARSLSFLILTMLCWACMVVIIQCYHCHHFCRTMLCISATYAFVRCLSVHLLVHLSVTFVYSVETNKDIFKIFSPSGSHTILVFPVSKVMTIFRRGHPPPPYGGAECRWGRWKSRFSKNIWLSDWHRPPCISEYAE